MYLKSYLISILFLIIFTSYRPGVSTVLLKAKSESGRTFFNAEFEDGEILRNAELSIDGESLLFTYKDKGTIIEDFANKVYTIHLHNKEEEGDMSTFQYVDFWALPSTLTRIQDDSHQYNYIYRFKGKLRATDPRKNKESNTPKIILNCELTSTGP